MSDLEPHRGTCVHVAFQLSHEPLLWVGNEEHLGEEAEMNPAAALGKAVTHPLSMWKGEWREG